MAFTQTDLENLERAIAKGELSVSVGDRKVTYRNLSELMSAYDMVRRQLAQAASPTPAYPRYQQPDFSDD